jgi:hypothetical protein
MIGSSRIDISAVGIRPKRRNFKAVSRSVPGSDIVFEQPRQLPFFNLSKGIAKPFLYGDAPKLSMGQVPVIQRQECYDEKSMAFAPVYLIPEPLKVVKDKITGFDFSELAYESSFGEEAAVPYNLGIRPAPRPLNKFSISTISEPTGDLYRTGTPAKRRNEYTTYDVGSLDRAILGY